MALWMNACAHMNKTTQPTEHPTMCTYQQLIDVLTMQMFTEHPLCAQHCNKNWGHVSKPATRDQRPFISPHPVKTSNSLLQQSYKAARVNEEEGIPGKG